MMYCRVYSSTNFITSIVNLSQLIALLLLHFKAGFILRRPMAFNFFRLWTNLGVNFQQTAILPSCTIIIISMFQIQQAGSVTMTTAIISL